MTYRPDIDRTRAREYQARLRELSFRRLQQARSLRCYTAAQLMTLTGKSLVVAVNRILRGEAVLSKTHPRI